MLVLYRPSWNAPFSRIRDVQVPLPIGVEFSSLLGDGTARLYPPKLFKEVLSSNSHSSTDSIAYHIYLYDLLIVI